MASPPFHVVFTFVIFSIFSFSLSEKGVQLNDFVHQTCKKTRELNDLCLSEINLDPHEDLKSNLTGLLTLFVNHTINNFNSSVGFLQHQLNSGALDRDTRDMYEACTGDFRLGIGDLQETLSLLLTKRSISTYMAPLENADSHITTCAEDFDGYPVPPEWRSRYKRSHDFLVLALEMFNLSLCNRVEACIP